MNDNTIRDLEIDEILSLIAHCSVSDSGRKRINPSAFTDDEAVISSRADRIGEIINTVAEKGYFSSYFVSLESLFSFTGSACYQGKDIYACGSFLQALKHLESYLDKVMMDTELGKLAKDILEAVDEAGLVKETHPLLYPLYRKAEEVRQKRQIYSQSFLSEHQDAAQNLNAVYRNERVVLPIRREKRGEVSGYIQGASQSGGTLYIEPFELVDLNNQVTLAEDEINRMKHQILLELSERIRSRIPTLKKADERVADFDFHYAAALFIIKSSSKRISSGPSISLINARHPLLGKRAVPITLSLAEGIRAVVLSGANAGGKTVSMKTAAVAVFLRQLTGYAPCDEASVLPTFSAIYTDIGDGQSISDSFSTFSHHMANVAAITSASDERSLILLDELGSGTDPEEGAALTIALLDYLSARGSTVFTTSHYGVVKMHAWSSEVMMNASMEFDERSEKPTYRIISGLPGESHAIETAKRMGLPKVVISAARDNIGKGANVTKLMNELAGRNRALDRKITQLELEKRALAAREKEAERKAEEYDELTRRLQKEGAGDISAFLSESRKELEKLVHDVSTGKLTKEKTKNVKAFLQKVSEKSDEADREKQRLEQEEIERIDISYSVGDDVFCGSYDRRGVILRDEGKGRYLVSVGAMKMTLTKKDLKPAPREEFKASSTYRISAVRPHAVLDVRGKTLKETLEILDTQIEGCLVHSLSSFAIIHGYGDGILSRGIHDYLKKQKDVKDYRFAAPEDGGMGKTYVFF